MEARNWSPEMRSASASSSAAKPSALLRFAAPASSSSAAYGDLGTVPIRSSSVLRATLIAIGHLTVRSIVPGWFGRSTLIVPPSTPSAQRSESSR